MDTFLHQLPLAVYEIHSHTCLQMEIRVEMSPFFSSFFRRLIKILSFTLIILPSPYRSLKYINWWRHKSGHA